MAGLTHGISSCFRGSTATSPHFLDRMLRLTARGTSSTSRPSPLAAASTASTAAAAAAGALAAAPLALTTRPDATPAAAALPGLLAGARGGRPLPRLTPAAPAASASAACDDGPASAPDFPRCPSSHSQSVSVSSPSPLAPASFSPSTLPFESPPSDLRFGRSVPAAACSSGASGASPAAAAVRALIPPFF